MTEEGINYEKHAMPNYEKALNIWLSPYQYQSIENT